MDKSEQLALIQRVERASGDQAKQALESMILKCTTKHPTIARAIKDAVDRYTPAPTIVYEGRETKDDQDPVLAPSHSKSAKKNHQISESEGDDAPATTSEKHRSTSLRQKKSKNELYGQTKQSGEHDVQRSPPSKKKKKEKEKRKNKHASKHQVEPQQNTGAPMGSQSQRQISNVIDLVTSSDIETTEKEQPRDSKPTNSLSVYDLDLVNPSEDEPFGFVVPKKQTATSRKPSDAKKETGSLRDRDFDTDLLDDTRSKDQQHAPIVGVDKSSQGGSGMKSTERGAGNRAGGRRTPSVTVSAAKASNHHRKPNSSSLGLDKKRKAPDLTVEDTHTNQPVDPTPAIPPAKKPRQNIPEKKHGSQGRKKCDKCEKTFSSIRELLNHRWTCQDKAAAVDHQHVSEAPANDQLNRSKQTQKAANATAGTSTTEPRSIAQLPLRPVQTAPADRKLSKPPPSFVPEPKDLACGPIPVPMSIARSESGKQSLPSYSFRPLKPQSSSAKSPGHQPRPPRPGSSTQHVSSEHRDKVLQICKRCTKPYKECDNVDGSCRFHPGSYRLLTWAQLNRPEFKGRWTCCHRPEEDAPPCVLFGRHARP